MGLKTWMKRLRGHEPVARVAFNQPMVDGPWGGSNVFVSQCAAYLRWRGYDVRFDLRAKVDLIILIDPRVEGFGPREIAAYRRAHPGTRVLHRVNECDQRKNTRFMDDLLRDANALADYTVFISQWLRDYHAERWFDETRPHRAIYNGADPRVFHPIGSAHYDGRGPFRVVTHHWSNNPMKGFDVYREVDRQIAEGELPDTELWVIGRWPEDIKWRRARVFPPTHGIDLARQLRACHAYVTASRWEPAGMHHVEGAQCGLPLAYHEDGGGIVEAGLRYGIGYRDDVRSAIRQVREDYAAMRARVLDAMPSGDRMCAEYVDVIQRMLSDCARTPAPVAGSASGDRGSWSR
jgi:glycosyltransferase involved in cell wall biosynthesis